jgi:hypothetical protein
MPKIETLKKGDFFRKKEGAKKTFTRGDYNRSTNRYECQNFDDISDYCELKKGTEVFTDFEF